MKGALHTAREVYFYEPNSPTGCEQRLNFAAADSAAESQDGKRAWSPAAEDVCLTLDKAAWQCKDPPIQSNTSNRIMPRTCQLHTVQVYQHGNPTQ